IAVKHSRIVFDGNNYSDEWVEEAERRGLPNIRSTVDATPAWVTEKAVALFEKHGVLSGTELHSRYEILLEQYNKIINIEAQTMLYMVKRQIMPAGLKMIQNLAAGIGAVKAVSGALVSVQERLLNQVSSVMVAVDESLQALEGKTNEALAMGNVFEQGVFYRDEVFTAMNTLRGAVDQLEELVDKEYWPLPSYAEMLFKL
ncbi:MAG: glutamine synthetase type III, partial [Desulfitobacterium hafniense]